MSGLGLRQLHESLNRKADKIQREFITISDRLRAIGQRLVESREDEHERLLVEQEELREQRSVVATEVNRWREHARQVVSQSEPELLRAYLLKLLDEGDEALRPAIERCLHLLDHPEDEEADPDGGPDAERPSGPAGRLLERARTEYDLRGSDPAPRQRAAIEFAHRPGQAQQETIIAQVETGMNDPDPIVREVATLTVIQLHRFRALNLADLDAAHESVKRLAQINHLAAIPPLIEILASPRTGYAQGQEGENGNSRMVALTRLIEWHTAAARAAVQARQFDRDSRIVRVAARALELFPGAWTGPLKRAPATST
jgi:hypothetical protein